MTPSLTQLKHAFLTWNATSPKKRHSNTSLKEQAIRCLEHHTYKEVSQATGISSATLQYWKKSHFRAQEKQNLGTSPEFVAITLNQVPSPIDPTPDSFSLQINLANGLVIKTKTMSMTSSIAFILALSKESKTCFI